MTTAAWALAFFAVYLTAIAILSWRGARQTSSFAAFAAGGSDMGVFQTALVAAACLTSTATFAINPGYVYRDGLAALVGFSLPVALGVALAFVVLGERIRRTSVAADGTIRALTLPAWIGERFGSPRLRSLYAILVLLLFSYAVLVLVGAVYITQATLGLSIGWASVLLVTTVVVLTVAGGTHAHATTTFAKGLMLLGAAGVLGWRAGIRLFGEGGQGLAALEQADPALLSIVRPGSNLFGGPLEVFLFPLVIGFALACQPHILVKALYVRDPKALPRVGWATGALFLLLGAPALLVGMAARSELGAGVAQDKVVAIWTASAFPAPLAALLGVILVAVAIGTLNALFLALGATLANDVAGPVARRITGKPTQPGTMLLAGRVATLVVGGAAAAVAANPPKLVWELGVLGVYAFAAAACPAVVAGCLEERPTAPWIGAAAFFGVLVHVGLYAPKISANPNLTGAAGVAAGLTCVGLGIVAKRFAAPVAETKVLEAKQAPEPVAV